MVTWIAKGKKSLISTMCMASRWTGMWMRIFSEWYMKQEKESGTWTSNIMAALSFRIIVMQLKATTKIFQTHLIPPVGRLCRGLGVTYLNEVAVDCGSGCDVVATAVCNRWRNSLNSLQGTIYYFNHCLFHLNCCSIPVSRNTLIVSWTHGERLKLLHRLGVCLDHR